MKKADYTLSFFIAGNIPSKKNSKRLLLNKKTGKSFIMSSSAYLTWEKEQMALLPSVPYPIERCNINISFIAHDRRKWDLTNKAESILDLIVKKGILIDDNYTCVNKLSLVFKGNDKLAAGAYVEIEANN